MAGSKFDLVEQASTYGSYHSNLANRIIHLIFVPAIIYGVFLWFSFYQFDFSIPVPFLSDQAKVAHLGFIPAVIWGVYLFTLEPVVGGIIIAIFLAMCFHVNLTLASYGTSDAFWLGVWIQIISWGAQVVLGHGVFEGRKPALTESLFQVFVAPFFLVLEVLFFFGYRKDLFDKVELQIAEKIRLLDSKKKKM